MRKHVDENGLRSLPSVDELLRSDAGRLVAERAGPVHAAKMAREVIAALRRDITRSLGTKDDALAAAIGLIEANSQTEMLSRTQRVINATGVVIHTNLGRAPLSEAARQAVSDEASRYCTLEYDLASGKRGRRGRRAEELLIELTGGEDALIVNNCAAAAFFVLTIFAAGGEVLISRGEMVEIGGDFRVPDVLLQSGASLKEVGTTNRTRISDYERAINSNSKLVLRVHPSNYRIVGFTARPSVPELVSLAKKQKLLVYEDIGSGALTDLSGVGLGDEPVVSRSIRDGVDIATFSGDKLVGGPQAGIIVGKKKYIEKLRRHPLYRALRVDKLTYSALEATLESHRRGSAQDEVPVLAMLSVTHEQVKSRAEKFITSVKRSGGKNSQLQLNIIDGVSAVGGGAAASIELDTALIALFHKTIKATQLESALRSSSPPVVARVADGKVLIDLRTVPDDQIPDLRTALVALAR